MKFDWDPVKADTNEGKHGVTFDTTRYVRTYSTYDLIKYFDILFSSFFLSLFHVNLLHFFFRVFKFRYKYLNISHSPQNRKTNILDCFTIIIFQCCHLSHSYLYFIISLFNKIFFYFLLITNVIRFILFYFTFPHHHRQSTYGQHRHLIFIGNVQ